MKEYIKKIYFYVTSVIFKNNPKFKAKLDYKLATGKKLNLENPKDLNEKLQWLNINTNDERKVRCADKYEMREYIQEKGFGDFLPNVLGIYESADEIDYNILPEKFVLKCTHGAGFNVICKDKLKLEIEHTNKKLDTWLKVDFGKKAGEKHYSKIKPRIMCESFLEGLDQTVPIDYKIFCFHGKPKFVEICKGRFENLKFYFYDLDWNVLNYQSDANKDSTEIKKPDSFDRMIEISKEISKDFNFVRVDFYDIKGRPIIGELTFTPHAGRMTSMSNEALLEVGNYLRI